LNSSDAGLEPARNLAYLGVDDPARLPAFSPANKMDQTVRSLEGGPPLFSETLFCRLCALPYDNFTFVSQCVRGFAGSGKGTPEFELDKDAISWVEPIAFEVQGSNWCSGLPPYPISMRIAVARLGILTSQSPATPYDIIGIVSPFSSLSTATRRYIVKQFLKTYGGDSFAIDIDLRTVLEGPLQAEIAGFAYEAGGVLYSIAGRAPLSKGEGSPGILKTLSFRAKHGSVDVQSTPGNQEHNIVPRLDLTVPEDPEGIYGVLEDLRFIFEIIADKVRVTPVQLDEPS
jgi:hypothetical protein